MLVELVKVIWTYVKNVVDVTNATIICVNTLLDVVKPVV